LKTPVLSFRKKSISDGVSPLNNRLRLDSKQQFSEDELPWERRIMIIQKKAQNKTAPHVQLSLNGYSTSIEEETKKNSDFRRVLYTGKYIQLVLMNLKASEGIPTQKGTKVLQIRGRGKQSLLLGEWWN
jgi:hypothetical protein